MARSNHPDIIVIGASAGGISALKQLVALLPKDLPASVFLVLHLPKNSPSNLDRVLSEAGSWPAVFAKRGVSFQTGRIYIAPPDFHLLVDDRLIRLSKGPKENLWRPSIDTLFRSAAIAHGVRVVGIILTGYLDDGVAGMMAVQRCGGLTMVQDPEEAAYPDLPKNVLSHVCVDYCLPIKQLAGQLTELVHAPAKAQVAPPDDLVEEASLVDAFVSQLRDRHLQEGESGFSCPECGGPLREYSQGGMQRYRCHIGHSFTEHSLLEGKSQTLEQALWTAFRLMVERMTLLRKLIANTEQAGLHHTRKVYEKELANLRPQVQHIRDILKTQSPVAPGKE